MCILLIWKKKRDKKRPIEMKSEMISRGAVPPVHRDERLGVIRTCVQILDKVCDYGC